MMANTPTKDSDPNTADPAADETAREQGTAQGATPSQGAAEGSRSVHDVIAALQAEAADLKDKWLRAHAEIENVRKRLEREKEDIAKYAVTKLARDIVGVSDNFQRAISAIPTGAAEQDPALKSFLEGVTLTERELLNALERHGIKCVQPLNEAFNPHLHQAVMEVPRSDVPEGTIVQVFQPGFMIEDRVLRPAMVGVAKGGPKVPVPSNGSGPVASPANENAPPG
jgi:molecular chaperone GrpE